MKMHKCLHLKMRKSFWQSPVVFSMTSAEALLADEARELGEPFKDAEDELRVVPEARYDCGRA